jgi:hypothetical protein
MSCSEVHRSCRAAARARRRRAVHNSKKPARLIDVGTPSGLANPRLVSFNSSMTAWAALSYVWGPEPRTMITTKENIQDRMDCIPVSTMPKAFRDAIELCWQLNIPYLWIDALCIIQPVGPDRDNEDWESQSAIMAQIYEEAVITIAATNAASIDEGCFTTPSSNMDIAPNVCPLFPEDAFSGMLLLPSDPVWWMAVNEAPLQRRGWTLQEQLLSTRVMHCTEFGIYWQCDDLQASEFHDKLTYTGISGIGYWLSGRPANSDDALTEPEKSHLIKVVWGNIVSEYSGRQLSFESDRLVALSAISHRVKLMTNDDFLAGLWRSALFLNLQWSSWG